jgi:hypothetical protein
VDPNGQATLFATLSAGGIWPGWLWGWLLAASAIGTSPPVVALARRLVRTTGTDLPLVAAAVQQASNIAWVLASVAVMTALTSAASDNGVGTMISR